MTRRQYALSVHDLVVMAALLEMSCVIMQQPLDQSGTHLPACYTRGEGVHVGQLSSFCSTHIFLADVSAVAYTGSSGSHRGEPAESSSACLNAVSDNIRAVII